MRLLTGKKNEENFDALLRNLSRYRGFNFIILVCPEKKIINEIIARLNNLLRFPEYQLFPTVLIELNEKINILDSFANPDYKKKIFSLLDLKKLITLN